MATFTRMPNYDIRNDGAGPYAVFYCETCGREFRSQPDIAGSIKQDLGRSAVSGLLRKVPLVGNAVADNVVGEDPRYSYKMTPQQIDSAWQQVQVHFRQCPTCQRVVCLSDFDTQSGYCQEDTPRTNEIAEARGAQAGAAIKGFAAAFGLDKALDGVSKAAEAASRQDDAGWRERAQAHARRILAAGITRIGDAAVPADLAEEFVAVMRDAGVEVEPLLIGPRIDVPAFVPGRAGKVLVDGGEYCHFCFTRSQAMRLGSQSLRATFTPDRDLVRALARRAGRMTRGAGGTWHTGVTVTDERLLRAHLEAFLEGGGRKVAGIGGIFGCSAEGDKQTIGAVAGGAIGGLLGNRIAGRGSRTLGTILGGVPTIESRIATDYVRDLGGTEECTVIGRDFRTNAQNAAFVNSLTGHVLELDDTHRDSITHVGAPVIPAAPAMAATAEPIMKVTEMIQWLLMPMELAMALSCDVARMARPSSVFVVMNHKSSKTPALIA